MYTYMFMYMYMYIYMYMYMYIYIYIYVNGSFVYKQTYKSTRRLAYESYART